MARPMLSQVDTASARLRSGTSCYSQKHLAWHVNSLQVLVTLKCLQIQIQMLRIDRIDQITLREEKKCPMVLAKI